MPNTLPGVKVTLADGYLSASDDSVNAERLLIIAAPGIGMNTGWKAATPTNLPYNPTNYKSDSAVVADWGVGSDVHIAFVMALKSGASSIYVSAMDSSKTDFATDVSVRETEFEKALEHADLVSPDLIVAHGVYANEYEDATPDRVSKFAFDLATKCYELSEETNPCMGVIGVVPCDKHVTPFVGYDATTVAGYINDLTGSLATVPFSKPLPLANVIAELVGDPESTDPSEPDLSRYLSIFVGEVIVNKQPGSEYQQVAPVAAGLIYKTGLDRAITGLALANVTNLAYNLSRAQRLALIGKYANPIALSADRQIICVDGWTLAQKDPDPLSVTYGQESVYTRISTVRIVNEVSKSTRRALEAFVGMQASTARMNSISTSLTSLYLAYKQQSILRDSSFVMNFDQATSKLSVDVTLVPFGEIREVVVTISVKLQ